MDYLMHLVWVLIALPLASTAQDPSFSQFYANRIYLNPALTGLEDGISLAGVSRNQWANVDDGFTTYGMTIEIQEPYIKSGFGLSLFHNAEGLAQLTTKSIGLSYSYTIPMKGHNIHIGLQGLWVQKSVDWSKIVFSDQIDAIHGVVYSSSHVPVMDRVGFSDFNMGILWRSEADLKIGNTIYRDTRSSFGISLSHAPSLVNPEGGNESLQNLNTTTAPRLTLHGGAIMPAMIFRGMGKKIKISPNFKYDLQGEELFKIKQNLKVITYGFYVLYEGFYLGAFYQNKHPGADLDNTNALIITLGAYISTGPRRRRAEKQKFFIGFSYDANTTGVGTKAGSVYEIAFRWTFKDTPTIFGSRRSKRSKGVLDCPSFY